MPENKNINVILVICDELRADALGCMGNNIVETPHIDSLAKDSVIFSRAYCSSPVCIPSRVSLATGRHPLVHGVLDNGLTVMDDEVSLYQVLSDRGYHTVNVGKWHVSVDKFGMDTNIRTLPSEDIKIGPFGISDDELRKKTSYKKMPGDISLVIHGIRPIEEDQTVDTLFTEEFMNQLELAKKREQPSFLRLSLFDPHSPYMPCKKYYDMYDWKKIKLPPSYGCPLDNKPIMHRLFHEIRGFRHLTHEDYKKSMASYYGLITHNDDRIGRVIGKLKELDMYDDSLIIFTADHGSMMGEFGYLEKWGYMYEQVTRIPLMIKLPKKEIPPTQKDTFVENVDIMPTVLDYLGVEIPENVHGKSLLPYLRGETEFHRSDAHSLSYCGGFQEEPALMVRDDKWKFTLYPGQESVQKGLNLDHYLTYSDFFDGDPVGGELYDMKKDPHEMNNLFNKPEWATVRAEYEGKIHKWKRSLGDLADYNSHKLVDSRLAFFKNAVADNTKRLNEVPMGGKFTRKVSGAEQ